MQNENFLLDDKTGNGNINLDGSDSDSTDGGDDIINESGIDFSNKDVTITDSRVHLVQLSKQILELQQVQLTLYL